MCFEVIHTAPVTGNLHILLFLFYFTWIKCNAYILYYSIMEQTYALPLLLSSAFIDRNIYDHCGYHNWKFSQGDHH